MMQPQQTIKNCQKPSEIKTTKLHSNNLPFCKHAINCNKRTHQSADLQSEGAAVLAPHGALRSAAPCLGQGWNGVLKPLPGSCKSQKSSDSKASPGQPSAADPSLKNRADVLLSRLRLIFSDLFHFFARSKNHQKSGLYQTPQNLKNRTPGCPTLDFGAIMDDFWHHFFDQFS